MYYLIFMHYLCFREVVTSLLAVSRFLRNACFSTLQPDWGKNNKVVKLYMVFPYKTFEVDIHQLVRFISKHEALKQFYYDDPTVTDRNQVRGLCEKKLVNLWGLTFHRGWARMLIDRTALLLRGGFSDQQGEDDDEMEAWIQEGGTQESHEEV